MKLITTITDKVVRPYGFWK